MAATRIAQSWWLRARWAVTVSALAACSGPGQLPPSTTGGPEFAITSPRDGAFIAGATFFAVQPLDANQVASVRFEIDGVERVPNTAVGEDAHKVFLIASDYPAGDIDLTARVTGLNGRTSVRSITVTNVPNPPSTDVVTARGAVLGTVEESGALSTLSLPGGDLAGATVSFTARTPEEVKDATGVDYEALGVTFLGAQEIESDRPIDQAVMVGSGGFGPMVQPGQAVVNYLIVPDPEGGVGQLVVANSASVAPNGDVISDPVPIVQAGSAAAVSSTGRSGLRRFQDGLAGPPGTRFEFEAQGFHVGSPLGNVAVFSSHVDGLDYVVPVHVRTVDSRQAATLAIPPMPAGAATLELVNRSTGSSTAPVGVSVQPLASVAGDPLAVLKATIAAGRSQLQGLSGGDPLMATLAQQGLAALQDGEEQLEALAESGDPEALGILTAVAAALQQADMPLATGGAARLQTDCTSLTVASFALDFMGSALMNAGRFNPTALAVGAAFRGASFVLTVAGPSFCDDPDSCPTPGSSNRGNRTTGMGSATPPGGGGCGGGGGGGGPLSLFGGRSVGSFQQDPGRVVVKFFVGGSSLPFVGETDAGGYFYIPFLPAGQPFLALAVDTVTLETRALEGIGPEVGDSVVMYFDFFAAGLGPPIVELDLDTNTSGTLEPGALDLYTFTATAGQFVSAGLFGPDGFTGIVDLRIRAPSGALLGGASSGSNGEFSRSNVLEITESGVHTLTISGRQGAHGDYVFGLAEVQPPQLLTLDDVFDALDGALDVYGAHTFFRIDGSAGERRNLVIAHPDGDDLVARVALRGPGAQPFYERSILKQASTTAVTRTQATGFEILSEAGEYVIELHAATGAALDPSRAIGTWELTVHGAVPQPIAIDESVSGSIDVPGAFDLYTFTAGTDQVVFFERQALGGTHQVRWRVEDASAAVVFDTILGGPHPGVLELTGGSYTLQVGGTNLVTGSYQFRIWDVPPPDEFAIAIGDAVSEGVPGPGAGHIESPGVRDIYSFDATPGQVVYFELQTVTSTSGTLQNVRWRVEDAEETLIFDQILSTDPGAHTLELGGTYTISVGSDTVSATGTYGFQLHDGPAPP